MADPAQSALAATAALRRSPGYQGLTTSERQQFDHDLGKVEAALGRPAYGRREGAAGRPSAALAAALSAPARGLETPADLRGPGRLGPSGSTNGQQQQAEASPSLPGFAFPGQRSRAPAPPRRGTATEVIGERAQRVLDAVDFPSFVGSLIGGTFTAIVDATAQQVRDYAALVADLAKSVDEFTRDRVTDDQARDFLHSRHGRHLRLVVPAPGEGGPARLEPRDDAEESPPWLSDYGLDGATLSSELAEGELLAAGRRAVGEDRMRTLATMVLMGINRIVVDDGQLRARLMFHARARERATAEVVTQTGGQQMGIAGRSTAMQSAVSTMVSTVDVNTQSDVSIKTDLVGEVAVRFRTETFDLQNFADTQAITLINRHALQRQPGAQEPAPTGTPAPTPPVEEGDA